MIDVLFLDGLQGDLRFPQDLVLPRQQLRAKVIALAVVHERLFFGGSIVLQLFQGQPIFTCKAGRRSIRPRGPYIAAGCDRQYRPSPWGARRPGLSQAKRSGRPAAFIAKPGNPPDMSPTLDLLGAWYCPIPHGK